MAPIASFVACAGAATLLLAASATFAPSSAVAAAAPDAHRSHSPRPLPTFSLPIGLPTLPSTSQAPQTTAPAGVSSTIRSVSSTPGESSAGASGRDGGGSGAGSSPSAGFTPQALPTQVPTAGSGPCVPDGRAPGEGADLELPQVSGGSADPGFLNWLRVSTVGPSTMLPPRIDVPNLTTLTLTRTADAESANLGMAASSGDRFGCALLDVGAGPGYQRIDYALTDAGFVSETVKGGTETLIVTYASISWSYLPIGSVAAVSGNGTINSQPGLAKTSLKHDAQLVGGECWRWSRSACWGCWCSRSWAGGGAGSATWRPGRPLVSGPRRRGFSPSRPRSLPDRRSPDRCRRPRPGIRCPRCRFPKRFGRCTSQSSSVTGRSRRRPRRARSPRRRPGSMPRAAMSMTTTWSQRRNRALTAGPRRRAKPGRMR